MFYELHLPFPPTVNNYYKKSRYGVRISLKGQRYRAEVLQCVQEQFQFDTLDEKLLVEVVAHMPDKRIRDLDNYMKALLDSLTEAGVWEDDSQIDQLPIYRGVNVFGGAIALYIHEAGPLIPLGVQPG